MAHGIFSSVRAKMGHGAFSSKDGSWNIFQQKLIREYFLAKMCYGIFSSKMSHANMGQGIFSSKVVPQYFLAKWVLQNVKMTDEKFSSKDGSGNIITYEEDQHDKLH